MEKVKTVSVTDSYHYYGLWNYSMCVVGECGNLINIRRGDEALRSFVEVKHLWNAHNQCGSKDAMDMDVYGVDSEENLVYFKRDVMNQNTALTTRDGRFDIELTFNKESIKHVKAVTEQVHKEYGARLNKLTVNYVETFVEEMEATKIGKIISDQEAYIKECEDSYRTTLSEAESCVASITLTTSDITSQSDKYPY